ncbi:hypothetical protein BJ138DRAFT_1158221 [Hygrophoropsis aurantiaca]|uniref:Uncharacterized protein n=1 Tax=Hygrophoropsis aurantiaca TaxID=72124 RepID=A0ACB8A591_9AGAM|nr:hypothetical protein BJ138DRAFT_1158221 [Hygrophoropsis aurantiaca]
MVGDRSHSCLNRLQYRLCCAIAHGIFHIPLFHSFLHAFNTLTHDLVHVLWILVSIYISHICGVSLAVGFDQS